MRATPFLAPLALLAIAGCAAPTETIQPVSDTAGPIAPFHAEDTWWIEPSTSEMSMHEVPLNLTAAFARLEVAIVARSTYVTELPIMSGEAYVHLLDPAGEVIDETILHADTTEATLAADAPAAGAWTLVLQAYGGSGNGMGDSLSWVADGTP